MPASEPGTMRAVARASVLAKVRTTSVTEAASPCSGRRRLCSIAPGTSCLTLVRRQSSPKVATAVSCGARMQSCNRARAAARAASGTSHRNDPCLSIRPKAGRAHFTVDPDQGAGSPTTGLPTRTIGTRPCSAPRSRDPGRGDRPDARRHRRRRASTIRSGHLAPRLTPTGWLAAQVRNAPCEMQIV